VAPEANNQKLLETTECGRGPPQSQRHDNNDHWGLQKKKEGLLKALFSKGVGRGALFEDGVFLFNF
jgi:hypothetical protein